MAVFSSCLIDQMRLLQRVAGLFKFGIRSLKMIDRVKTAAILFFLVGSHVGHRAFAVDIHSLYTASCKRKTGMILRANDRHLWLLNTSGKIEKIERFEVIYLTSYPLDLVPIVNVENPEAFPLFEVKTLQNKKMVSLVVGWPIDFSKDKISFLSIEGSEIAVLRSSIWQINSVELAKKIEFNHRVQRRYDFVHPYAFQNCAHEFFGRPDGRATEIYPQLLMNDPVLLKKEFDRLQDGHQEIARYQRDQQFYPRPELYKNRTSLGMWYSVGSRHGASKNRGNNFSPILIDELSNGPFSYQQIFLTGAAPMPYSIHEEVQTQAYYRMKADYFHLSLMADPNLLLVGSRYKWSQQDMGVGDLRMNEGGIMEFGFDYGPFSIEFYPLGSTNFGARSSQGFEEDSVNLVRGGLAYTGRHFKLAGYIGSFNGESWVSGQFFRLNFEYQLDEGKELFLSYIRKAFEYDGFKRQILNGGTAPMSVFRTRATSQTVSANYIYPFTKRIQVGGFLGLESIDNESEHDGEPSRSQFSKTFVKSGLMASLFF